MATVSGDANGTRSPVMPYVAYAVVLALIGAAGLVFWFGQRGRLPILPQRDRASPAVALAAPVEPSGLKLPPREERPAPIAAAGQKPAQAPVPIPSSASPAAIAGDPAEKPAPAKSRCTVDVAWPAEKTDQGKAIQGMLRDLGLYDGTVYGTVGPTTRAAIRKFQLSAGQPETGEPDEALFDSLRKKCVAP